MLDVQSVTATYTLLNVKKPNSIEALFNLAHEFAVSLRKIPSSMIVPIIVNSC